MIHPLKYSDGMAVYRIRERKLVVAIFNHFMLENDVIDSVAFQEAHDFVTSWEALNLFGPSVSPDRVDFGAFEKCFFAMLQATLGFTARYRTAETSTVRQAKS